MSAGAEGSGGAAPVTIRRAVATAPGKLILMGEHAAVYGRAAVVAALGLRTRVEIEAAPGGVEMHLADLDHRATVGWDEIDAFTEAYAERWRRFDREPTSAAFAELDAQDPAKLVKLALGETRRALGGAAQDRGLRLRVSSEIPIGSGFGSSASLAVAVSGALLAFSGRLAPGEEPAASKAVSAVALEVERRQHGRPSGVDHTTVLHGGLLRVAGGAERRAEPLAAAGEAIAELRVFDTGPPAESTGEAVAAVRSRRDADPDAFAARLAAMEAATERFGVALTASGRIDERLTAVREFERQLEALEVVPASVAAAVRRIESGGGAAKVSGAGALTGEAAGALLVCWPAASDGEPGDALPGYPCHRAAIGASGLTIEGVE